MPLWPVLTLQYMYHIITHFLCAELSMTSYSMTLVIISSVIQVFLLLCYMWLNSIHLLLQPPLFFLLLRWSVSCSAVAQPGQLFAVHNIISLPTHTHAHIQALNFKPPPHTMAGLDNRHMPTLWPSQGSPSQTEHCLSAPFTTPPALTHTHTPSSCSLSRIMRLIRLHFCVSRFTSDRRGGEQI